MTIPVPGSVDPNGNPIPVAPKSCVTCPSFLQADQVPDKFNRSIGSPVCGRYGTVLGRPGFSQAQETAIQTQIGTACPKHGEPMPSQPDYQMYVMLPIPELRDPANINDSMKNACTSCAMCSNLVSEATVVSETGWSAGLCSAKGKLILSNRQSREAQDCDFRQFGTPRTTTGGLHFSPEYSDTFNSSVVTPTQVLAEAASMVEPSEYPTDREVSEGDTTAGIRAWRQVFDPEGTGKSVFFPVYDASFFDDDQRQLIPKTGSDEHPELYIDHFGGLYGLGVAWMELDETPVFWGVAGVGKTELLRYASWIMQLPFHRLSITATSEVDDVIGKYEYDPVKGTWFRLGRLPVAWTQPGVLCIDEPNTGPPEIWQRIRPLTDNSKQMVLDEWDARILDRHSDCYMGMAMNPAWDVRNLGALEVADADANRLFHTFIDMPPEEVEKEIIQARVKLDGWELSPAQLKSLMDVARDLRKLSDDERLPVTWAIRPQIKVARALRWFSPTTAYRRAAGDYLDPEAQQILLDQVRAHFNEEW